MSGFVKFDAWAFLERERQIVDKGETLASLATLAGPPRQNEDHDSGTSQNQRQGVSPAKVANPAKVLGGHPPALANLATLADCHPNSNNSARSNDAEFIAPVPWFARVASPTEDEPPFEMPCAARRGRVEHRDGLVLHFCAECGAWGSFGYSVNVSGGRFGYWYCAKHRPLRA